MQETIQTRLAPVSFENQLSRVVVSEEARDHSFTEEILKRAVHHGVQVEKSLPDFEGKSLNSRYRTEKQTLHLRINKGSFIKPWESPPSIVGRDEWCLTPVEGCPLDCSYCYLQDYLDRPLIQVFVNQENIKNHVSDFLQDPPEEPPHFFSLGELSDGLFLEPIVRTVPKVWDLFRESEAKIEIRSKSHHIHGMFSDIEPHRNGVFTWTLTPDGPDQRDEMLTSPLEERLNALKTTRENGFRVAVRMDPIVLRPNWLEQYKSLVKKLSNTIQLDELTFLLVGLFRFPAGSDQTMQERFPNRDFLRNEFVEGPDGKYRYPRTKRTEAYRKLGEIIRNYGGDPNLCMEPEYIWNDAGYN